MLYISNYSSGGGSGTVTNIATGTGLTGGPITSTGTISLSTALAPMATLTGNSLKVLRVNAGETAVEYATAGVGDMILASTQTNSGAKTFLSNTLLLRNPGNTFSYTITPAAIAADRVLTLPLITATDTLATLGLAQTFTGVNTMSGLNVITHSSAGLIVRNPANTFSYTITGGAIAAARTLNLPVITGTDTLAVLGLAQTFTATQTFGTLVATTVNGNTITTGTGTLTLGASKTLTVNNSIALTGTDGTVMTFPTTSKTIAANDGSNMALASQATGDLIVASSATAIGRVADVAVGQVLVSGGVGVAPAYSANPQVTTIELGNASDTTISRTGPGAIAVEGVGVALNSTSLTHTASQYEVGNASDTTITRSSAGVIAVEGVAIPSVSSTSTLTNKRIQPRTASSTTASNLSPDLATANVYFRTTQTATLTIDAPTGTPVIGETIMIYVDSAGAQTLTINATYVAFGAAFPATTTAGKTFMMSAQYNGTNWKTLWANAI